MKNIDFIIKNFQEKNIIEIRDFFKDNKIYNLKYKTSHEDYFQLFIKKREKNMLGGDFITDIKISPNKYKFRLDEYNSFDDKIFAIIKLDAKMYNDDDYQEDDYCAYMIIDEKNKQATIQSLTNYKKCIKCLEKNIDYKVGDILMQIMLITAKKKGIEKIYATDNSYMTCGNYKFQLIYLRTLTHGRPLYTKYKFIPIDKKNFDICTINHELFNKNSTISKNRIIKIINKQIEKKYIDYFVKYINNLYNNSEKFVVSELFLNIIKDSKNNNKLCDLIYFIYKPIYYYVGYRDYKNNSFYLNLKNVDYSKK